MSVAIPIKSIPPLKAKLLAKHLTITPEKEKSFFATSAPFNNFAGPSVEAFDLVEQVDEKGNKEMIAYLPFSYCYHHLSSVPVDPRFQIAPTPCSFVFQGELLPRQKEIKEETLDILNRTKSVILCLHTGFGKTIYALYLAAKIRLKTIILCHRKIIMDQWVSAVQKYIPNASVGIWSPKLKSSELPDILIANVLNIKKWPRSTYASYGLLIADEVHTMCTEQFSIGFLYLTPRYLIGLSATPFRSDGMDRLIELFVGPEIVYRPMKKTFNVYQLRTQFEPQVSRLDSSPDGSIVWNSVLESQALDPERNRLICDLIRIFSNRVILVLVKRIDHAKILYQILHAVGEDVDMFLGSDKTVNYQCRVLIATYSKGGVGFDHPRLDMLITAADVEENFMQYLGRVFRRDDTTPIYLDLIDKLPTLSKHASTRKKICLEVGGLVYNFKKAFPDFDSYRSHLI